MSPTALTAIVQAIVFLAHSLGLVVVAEGVEREDQLNRLWQLDCDRVQGYYFAPPLPASAIARLLKERVRMPVASVARQSSEIVHAPGACGLVLWSRSAVIGLWSSVCGLAATREWLLFDQEKPHVAELGRSHQQ